MRKWTWLVILPIALAAKSSVADVQIHGPNNACVRAIFSVRPSIDPSDYDVYWEYNFDGTGWQEGPSFFQDAGADFELELDEMNSYVDVNVYVFRASYPYDDGSDEHHTSCSN